MFKIGNVYTRDEIHDKLGGGKQTFLPTNNNKVVCACITKDKNPNAPYEVVVGSGPVITNSAKKFAQQGNYVPTFIKHKSNKWAYQGDFRVKHIELDQKKIQEKYNLAGRKNIQLVLELESK